MKFDTLYKFIGTFVRGGNIIFRLKGHVVYPLVFPKCNTIVYFTKNIFCSIWVSHKIFRELFA